MSDIIICVLFAFGIIYRLTSPDAEKKDTFRVPGIYQFRLGGICHTDQSEDVTGTSLAFQEA